MDKTLSGRKRLAPEKLKEEDKNSEISPFQVCIIGLPKYTTVQDVYKNAIIPLLPSHEDAVVGVNKQANKNVAYVLFKSETNRKEFVTEFNKEPKRVKFHGVKLTTYVPKLLTTKEFIDLASIIAKIKSAPRHKDLPMEVIENQVLPWIDIPYKDQIARKVETLKGNVERFFSEIKELQGGIMVKCPFEKMIESDPDKIGGYRNKVELSIGFNSNKEIDIGFIKGKIGALHIEIDSANNYPHIADEVKFVGQILLKIIKQYHESDGLNPFNRINAIRTCTVKEGNEFWRLLQVRQSYKTKEMMLTLVHTKNIISHELNEKIRNSLKAVFPLNGSIGEYKLVSLNVIQTEASGGTDYEFDDVVEALYESAFYSEELLGYKFHVSPLSFLQVNTDICEKLYDYVRQLAASSVKSDVNNIILFDLYCGIGTIGICMEKLALEIVGIELVPSAIENAKYNAELNGLSAKTKYYCGKVEELISKIASQYDKKPIIAIVDPPRGGLHKDVISKIRTCKGLDVLIYVSCNQQSLVRDALLLCKPAKGKMSGPGFTATSYAGADLFPYTPHTECIMEFKRYYSGSICS